MLSLKRIIATRLLKCVAVLREWIRVTAPGNSVNEIGSCQVGMIPEFARFQCDDDCVVEPCGAGGDILRAAHQAWGQEKPGGDQVYRFGVLPYVSTESVRG